jgi:hypothetical protein
MQQDLYFEYVNTVVRKGSPYLGRLNKFIHRLLDSGLIFKWEEQVRYSAGPVPKWRVSKIAPSHTISALNLRVPENVGKLSSVQTTRDLNLGCLHPVAPVRSDDVGFIRLRNVAKVG